MKPVDLRFMFSEMVQRSEQLFFTPLEGMDERLFHLPLFLEALASIIKEVDEVKLHVSTGAGGGGSGVEDGIYSFCSIHVCQKIQWMTVLVWLKLKYFVR